MDFAGFPLWKEAPFIRLLLPFVIGILTVYYTANPVWISWILFSLSFGILFFIDLANLKWTFLCYNFVGILINLLLFATGGIIAGNKNPFASKKIIEKFADGKSVYSVTISEPLSEKPSSWKTLARINSIQNKKEKKSFTSDMLLYFRKDSLHKKPVYGDRILFIKSPENIKNAAAMKTFNYVKYCALKNIHCQVFLDHREYIRLPGGNTKIIWSLIYTIRARVVEVLRKYIKGKEECGLALAILIGYKDELDKNLVQSYSNTGVVHVVAISGLHLGLIYGILKFFCIPFRKRKWMPPAIILSGLWLFSLLAGATPSVLRSAVMFSFIVTGEAISRKSSLPNNLSASAFFLLCYDPYWLWDLGFLLSYSALLSIVIFMKPIYHLFIFKNKIADTFWKLNAVTISAQILTMPIIIYYFMQFPNYFLLTNFIAIPVSSIILIAEIILCSIYYFEELSRACGWLISYLIKFMNGSVRFVESLRCSTTYGLDINFIQLILLYVFIFLASGWLVYHKKTCLPAALISAIFFFGMEAIKIWQ